MNFSSEERALPREVVIRRGETQDNYLILIFGNVSKPIKNIPPPILYFASYICPKIGIKADIVKTPYGLGVRTKKNGSYPDSFWLEAGEFFSRPISRINLPADGFKMTKLTSK